MLDNGIADFRMKLIKIVKFWSVFLFTLKHSATLRKPILALRRWTAKIKFLVVTLFFLCWRDEWLYR